MRVLILLISIVAIVSCKDSNSSNYITKKELNAISTKAFDSHPGEKLMKNYCFACHNATTSEENRIAPPMISIKKRYLLENPSKAEFIKSMQEFIKDPEENIIMLGAVERFGVMPKTVYPDEVIVQIADYMYDFEMEQPDWYKDHFKQKSKKYKNMNGPKQKN